MPWNGAILWELGIILWTQHASLLVLHAELLTMRGDGVGYAAGPGYLITYLVRRHARVELRPNFLRPERVRPSAELALRLDFVVALQNLVDLVPRQQG